MRKLLLFGLLLFFGCNDSSKQNDFTDQKSKHKYSSFEKAEILKEKCLTQGDKNAYNDLVDYYGNNPSAYHELLPIAIIMADKYNNDNARVSIYFQFMMMENDGKRDDDLFFKLDKSKKNFILKYLIDGANNKNSGCLGILKKIIKGGIEVKGFSEKEIDQLLLETTTNRR